MVVPGPWTSIDIIPISDIFHHPQDGTTAASTELLAPREGPTNSWAAVPGLDVLSTFGMMT